MSLIVEDGSLVADADTYASVAEARAYALSRGLTLPATDAAVEVLLRSACDFLQSFEDRFKGSRMDTTQALAWPRQGVYLYGSTTVESSTAIPSLLKNAQCRLAYDASLTSLMPTGSGKEVLSESVGPLSKSYAKSGSGTVRPVFNTALAILQPLFKVGLGSLSVTRV